MTDHADAESYSVLDLAECFHGAIPSVLATASAAGIPNITYLSLVHGVDRERVALSNQFFSKSTANLAENPRASLVVIDPITFDEYRLTIVYERTDRRGTVFESLKAEVDTLAAIQGMQDVFSLRAADIFRVESIEHFEDRLPPFDAYAPRIRATPTEVAGLCAQIGGCTDLDAVIATTINGVVDILGYEHAVLLLVDEERQCLVTIASRGYDGEGVGSEVPLGDGVAGVAAQRGVPLRFGGSRQIEAYGASVRRQYEESGEIAPGREIPLPSLTRAHSRLAVPAAAMGRVVAVLQVEDERPIAFDATDEASLQIVAALAAQALDAAPDDDATPAAPPTPRTPDPADATDCIEVRFFPVDGSTFLDGDYLIKGVAGRLLWSLLRQHAEEGRCEFTNREVRLDPTLDLPDLRQNFESRLILLKRRLDERECPVRIERSGRGRFLLRVPPGLAVTRREMT
jgi:adenylate cyclase